MKRPANYQELQHAAVREIRLKKEALLERAENLERLAAGFFSIANFESAPRKDIDPLLGNVFDYGDDTGIPALNEITTNWPYIASEPGEGYW